VASPNKPKFRNRLKKSHAFLYIEHWKEGEKPINWFAEWQHLTVELSDISFGMSENIVTRHFGRDEDKNYLTLWNESDTRDSDVVDGVSDEAAELYEKIRSSIFNHSFKLPELEQSNVISSTFTTKGNRSIAFIQDGDDCHRQQTTDTGRLKIYSSTRIQHGYIWIIDEDEQKWGSSEAVGTACINVYVPFNQALRLQAQLKQSMSDGLTRRIQAQLSVLAFQSEVERSLGEPYHSQTYSFTRGAFSPVMLQGVSILQSEPTAKGKDVANKLFQRDETLSDLPEKKKAPSGEQPARGNKALVITLWAIAIAILLHAL
jgi:hypothetical protein